MVRRDRDLHGVVTHGITTISVQAGVAAHVLDRQPEQARLALRAIKDSSGRAMRELRAMLAVLRHRDGNEPPIDTYTIESIPNLLAAVRSAGLEAQLAISGVSRPLPQDVGLAGYRVVQESLTNVLRHSPASAVQIALDYTPDRMSITVTDAGGTPGIGGVQESGHGIAGMRERVKVLGGQLTAAATPTGFQVHCVLPLPAGV